MRFWIKLLLFLLLALPAAIFLYWRFSPEQAIIKRADVIFKSVEKKTIGSGTPEEKARRFREVLASSVEVKAPRPIESDEFTPPVLAGLVEQFQESVASCRISREDETVAFPSDELAIYQATVEADVGIAPNHRRVMRYRCRFEFERAGKDWLLRLIVLTAI